MIYNEKFIYLKGAFMDDIKRAREGFNKLSFTGKLEHIWYYYKWFILLGLAVVIFFLTCLTQCTNRKNYDATFMYVGPQSISSNYIGVVTDSVADIMSEDYNGDGYKAATIIEVNLAPDSPSTDTEKLNKAMQYQTRGRERFYIERTTGTSVIYLVDEEIYYQLSKEDFLLVPLEEVLGFVPEKALDEKGIRISDLDCYKYTDICYLPADTVLCIRHKREGSMKDDNEKIYQANVDTFIDLITWENTEESENE